MKFISFAVITGVAASLAAIDLSGYRRLPEQGMQSVPVVNAQFENGTNGWDIPEGYAIDNGGRSGTGALVCERADPSVYKLAMQDIPLIPNKRYRFSVWIRSENVAGPDHQGATVCLEYRDGSKYMGGNYAEGILGTKDWTKIESIFIADKGPLNDPKFTLKLYLRRGLTGKAWFDDIRVDAEGARWHPYIIQPTHETLSPNGGTLTLGSFIDGVFMDGGTKIDEHGLTCTAEFIAGGKTISGATVPIRENRIVLSAPKMPAGKAALKLTLIDERRKVIIDVTTIDITVRSPLTTRNACIIDTHGRTFMNGKPFLPVGLYLSSIKRSDISRLAVSPFNCVLPYGSMNLKLDGSTKTGTAAVSEVLDELDRNGLKIIFSIKDVFEGSRWARLEFDGVKGESAVIEKAVASFRDHPALLAWYVNDEMPLEMTPRLFKRRREVNRLDPFHPTWTVLYQYNDLPFYGGSSDVIGVDPYPIKKASVIDMIYVRDCVKGAYRSHWTTDGGPLWHVWQVNNLAAYDAKSQTDKVRRHTEFRDPTEEEMRSFVLMMAIFGAKGFVGYSYFDMFKAGWEEEAARRWPEICRVGELLTNLMPFLYGEQLQPIVNTETGEVYARAFKAAGKVRILIAAVGPGPSKAEITFPGTTFTSKYGRTISSGNGKYMFSGDNICSDVLE